MPETRSRLESPKVIAIGTAVVIMGATIAFGINAYAQEELPPPEKVVAPENINPTKAPDPLGLLGVEENDDDAIGSTSAESSTSDGDAALTSAREAQDRARTDPSFIPCFDDDGYLASTAILDREPDARPMSDSERDEHCQQFGLRGTTR